MCICRKMSVLDTQERFLVSRVSSSFCSRAFKVCDRWGPAPARVSAPWGFHLLDAAVKDVRERSASSRSSQCILPLCALCRGCIAIMVLRDDASFGRSRGGSPYRSYQ
jgi:hypothetical protein